MQDGLFFPLLKFPGENSAGFKTLPKRSGTGMKARSSGGVAAVLSGDFPPRLFPTFRLADLSIMKDIAITFSGVTYGFVNNESCIVVLYI